MLPAEASTFTTGHISSIVVLPHAPMKMSDLPTNGEGHTDVSFLGCPTNMKEGRLYEREG